MIHSGAQINARQPVRREQDYAQGQEDDADSDDARIVHIELGDRSHSWEAQNDRHEAYPTVSRNKIGKASALHVSETSEDGY